MSEKMYTTDFINSRKGIESFINKASFIRLDQLRIKEEENEDSGMFLRGAKDLQAIQDKRDADYFIRLLTRKEDAVQEYSMIQKAVQREKVKNTPMFKKLGVKELFDSVPTPGMDDFDIIVEDRTHLINTVRQLCNDKKFKTGIKYTARFQTTKKINYLKFNCRQGPYFESSTNFNSSCPFHLIYKYNEDEEEFYLDCFDEMHNHLLVNEPRIMPYQKKSVRKPIFTTPMFFRFQTFKANDLKHF